MSITRREFLKSSIGVVSAASLASTPLFAIGSKAEKFILKPPLLMVSTGESPAGNVRKVIAALGGIEKFVKPGDRVFLKPNSITRLGPQFAVNTNPDVVREVARLCRIAGAAQITAMTHDDVKVAEVNGIGAALEAEGGTIKGANDIAMYQQVNLPIGLILRQTMVIRELLEYDVFINIPVAKHHAGSRLTVGMKNYMGLNWDRQVMHRTDIHQTIADLVTVRKPDLTLVDATRILLNNGPSGPGTVRETKSVIASRDPIAADAYTATLFKHEPRSIQHIHCAYEMGLGEIDPKRMNIRKFEA